METQPDEVNNMFVSSNVSRLEHWNTSHVKSAVSSEGFIQYKPSCYDVSMCFYWLLLLWELEKSVIACYYSKQWKLPVVWMLISLKGCAWVLKVFTLIAMCDVKVTDIILFQ